MGDRYYLQIMCGDCGTKNPSDKAYQTDPMTNGVYYAPSSGFMHFACEKCKKLNWIVAGYCGKVVTGKELDKLYEEEGFE